MENKQEVDVDYLNLIINNFKIALENNSDHIYVGYHVFKPELDENIKQYKEAVINQDIDILKNVAHDYMCGQINDDSIIFKDYYKKYPDLILYWLENGITDKFYVNEYIKEYQVDKNNWNVLLGVLLEQGIEIEAYEQCSELRKIQKIITQI